MIDFTQEPLPDRDRPKRAFGLPRGSVRALITLGLMGLMGATVIIAQLDGGVEEAMTATGIFGPLAGVAIMSYFNKDRG